MFKFMMCLVVVGMYTMIGFGLVIQQKAAVLKWPVAGNGFELRQIMITNDQLTATHGDTSKFQEAMKRISKELFEK